MREISFSFSLHVCLGISIISKKLEVNWQNTYLYKGLARLGIDKQCLVSMFFDPPCSTTIIYHKPVNLQCSYVRSADEFI